MFKKVIFRSRKVYFVLIGFFFCEISYNSLKRLHFSKGFCHTFKVTNSLKKFFFVRNSIFFFDKSYSLFWCHCYAMTYDFW